jgi:hypothetical protein
MRWRRSLEPPHRLKDTLYRERGSPESRLYKAWKLFADADKLAVLTTMDPALFEQLGELILEFTHKDSSASRVLWLSDKHLLLCSGQSTNHNPFPFLPPFLWRRHTRTNLAMYELSRHSLAADDTRTLQVLRALNHILALGRHIFDAYIAYAPGLPAYGIEDFVSRTRSSHPIDHLLMGSVAPETGRAVVRNCNTND